MKMYVQLNLTRMLCRAADGGFLLIGLDVRAKDTFGYVRSRNPEY